MSNQDIRKYMTIVEALHPGPTSLGPSKAIAMANNWLRSTGKARQYTALGTQAIPGGWRVGLMSTADLETSSGQPRASVALDLLDGQEPRMVKL